LEREEAARKRAEEEEKARKVAEKEAATALRISQEHELEALRREQLAKAAVPKSSKKPMIIGIAIGVLLAAGVGVYFMLSQEEMDIYALPEESVTRTIGFIDEDMQMARINASIVKQAEDPKPVAAPKNRPKRPAAAAAPEPSKPSLTGGRGGLFGGGKL
jgi:hypothetical protein